jgi:hypothetical protein
MRTFGLPDIFPVPGAGWLEVTAALFHTRGMKVNRMPLLMVPVLGLGSCAQAPPQPAPAPRVATPAPPPPQYTPPPPRPAPPRVAAPTTGTAGWRDLPQTPGRWTYAADSAGSAVRFGPAGAAPLLVLRCDRSRPALVLQRPGFGAGTVPAAISTSSTVRRLSASPAAGSGAVQNAALPFEIAFAIRDPLLDAIAFSRGRWVLEMGGAETLVLPAWSEIGRVIEDCR